MKRQRLIPAAWLLDQVAGDPEWFPHPVRLIGFAISRGEQAIRRPKQSPAAELLTGAALTLSIVGSTYLLTRTIIRYAHRNSPLLGDGAELLLAWTCLAARNLHDEAAIVTGALADGDLPRARRQLARIVGRDTEGLDASEVSRAVIETLAESASDGILAPLFYLALGGVPAAMAYKAVNTLDSMIGHADERYLYFGKVAARLDDLANLVPARLTAAALVLAAALTEDTDPASALRIWLRDGGQHKSPNAGQPESVMAGALRVRLGGVNTYAGERIAAPIMAREFAAPALAQARLAMRLVTLVTILGVFAATTAACLRGRSR